MPEPAPGIDRRPDEYGGEPCVAGTRVQVRRIGRLRDRDGIDPAEIAERFDRTLGDVHRALAYRYDHPGEMGDYERRDREQNVEEAESLSSARDRLQGDS